MSVTTVLHGAADFCQGCGRDDVSVGEYAFVSSNGQRVWRETLCERCAWKSGRIA